MVAFEAETLLVTGSCNASPIHVRFCDLTVDLLRISVSLEMPEDGVLILWHAYLFRRRWSGMRVNKAKLFAMLEKNSLNLSELGLEAE